MSLEAIAGLAIGAVLTALVVGGRKKECDCSTAVVPAAAQSYTPVSYSSYSDPYAISIDELRESLEYDMDLADSAIQDFLDAAYEQGLLDGGDY